jgi:hypothetical protein
LESQRREAIANLQRAESQIIAIDELLAQYKLLDDRYRTDLERLDFIAEGAHYFDGLQETRCPLCDQLMSPDHAHKPSESSATIYQAAKAEASKILAHRTDLMAATSSLTGRRSTRQVECKDTAGAMKRIDSRISDILVPAVHSGSEHLNR